ENLRLISATAISIDVPIGGASPIHDLIVSAGSNIFFGGSIHITGDLIVERGAQVTFDRDVTVHGNIIIGDASSPGDVGVVTFNASNIVNVEGEIRIHTNGGVEFRNSLGATMISELVVVGAGGTVNFFHELTAGAATISGANVNFERAVRVGEASVTAADLLT